VDKPGLKLVETIAPQILQVWRATQREHPGCDDLVASLEETGEGVAVTLATREEFIAFMRESGRWVENSSWDALLKPAGLSAIWVVVHLQGRSAITRLVNPILSKGGDA
jgi:hypothetical protein